MLSIVDALEHDYDSRTKTILKINEKLYLKRLLSWRPLLVRMLFALVKIENCVFKAAVIGVYG